MQLPKLPKTVRIIPESCFTTTPRPDGEAGEPIRTMNADALAYIVKPMPMMHIAGAVKRMQQNAHLTQAEITLKQLVTVEPEAGGPLMIGDEVFDKDNEEHIAALNPAHFIEVGETLFYRTHLSKEELGK